jgi:hypothetical protein
VQSGDAYPCNFDLGFGVEESIGKLLALAEGALDDFEPRDCGQNESICVLPLHVATESIPLERKSPTGAYGLLRRLSIAWKPG